MTRTILKATPSKRRTTLPGVSVSAVKLVAGASFTVKRLRRPWSEALSDEASGEKLESSSKRNALRDPSGRVSVTRDAPKSPDIPERKSAGNAQNSARAK